MPLAARTCSECGSPLANRSVTAKTCSDKCRLQRSRRIRRANREIEEYAENNNAGAAEIAAIVRREAPDVVTRVMKEQLAPVIREALTEDVLRAVDQMVGLTPAAVSALQDDLGSEDATVRQRAYSLVIKYTIGHPALLRQEDTDSSSQMVVNFNLPRPEVAAPVEAEDGEPLAMVLCDMCDELKLESEFVAGSTRCNSCFETWKTAVLEQFA